MPPDSSMMKRMMQRVANSLGYEVRRLHAATDNDPFLFARGLIQSMEPMVFDVGAHDGETARRLRQLFPEARIHCFEPFPDSFALLERATHGDPRTDIHRVGLADSRGTAMMNLNASSATNSLLRTDPRATETWGAGLVDTVGTIAIPTATLDDFCDERGIDRIDLLKLDTQGSELGGSARMLARQAVGVLVFELITASTYAGQRSPSEYFALLESHGYALSGVFSPIYRSGVLAQCDVAFTPRR
jgi:FkbM family methyltransferase